MFLALKNGLGRLAIFFRGLLDEYGGAAAAYSLRKLSGSYSGFGIKIRRSGDNAEANVALPVTADSAITVTFGTSSATTLNEFVTEGSNQDAYVVTWYDQSGNGNDATAPADTNEPKIVSAGTYLGLIRTDGVDDFFNLDTQINFNSSHGLFAVYADAGGNRFNLLGKPAATNGIGWQSIGTISTTYGMIGPSGNQANTPFAGADKTQQNLISILWQPDSVSAIYSLNGDNKTVTFTVGQSFANDIPVRLTVMGRDDDALGSLDLKEIIVYTSDQTSNRTAIESNIADEYGITLT